MEKDNDCSVSNQYIEDLNLKNLAESLNKRVDKLIELKTHTLWHAFTSKLQYVIREYNYSRELIIIKSKIVIDNALDVFKNEVSLETSMKLLYIASNFPCYSINERINFGKEFLLKRSEQCNKYWINSKDFDFRLIAAQYNNLACLFDKIKDYEFAKGFAIAGISFIEEKPNNWEDESTFILYSDLNGTLNRILFVSREYDNVKKHGEMFLNSISCYSIKENGYISDIV